MSCRFLQRESVWLPHPNEPERPQLQWLIPPNDTPSYFYFLRWSDWPSSCTQTRKRRALRLSFCWRLSERHVQPCIVCYIHSCSCMFFVTVILSCNVLLWHIEVFKSLERLFLFIATETHFKHECSDLFITNTWAVKAEWLNLVWFFVSIESVKG